MKNDKIQDLKIHFMKEWNSTRIKVFDELSDNQSMFCCCGKLATGLHESNCRKFNAKVDAETVYRLREKLTKKTI